LESLVRKVTFLAILGFTSFAALCGASHAQQMDAAFGFNAVHATSAGNAASNYSAQSLGGGLTPSFSADFLLKHNFGVGAELSWRGSKATYAPVSNISYRPFFYDFNAVWAPRVTRYFSPEVMAGIGGENSRFYVAPSCGLNCQNYVTTNHFLTHLGGGLRFYVARNFFVRPEAHWYYIHNNNQFSSPYATRFGASIGYSFGGR
jgi:hypothetical protein